jgi:hypothetical protein
VLVETMLRSLAILAAVFGLVCVGIALAHLVLGPASIPGSIPVNATMDSEDRFYATLFLGFGVAMVWSSRDLRARAHTFEALMAIFFLGGIARIISMIVVGPPIPFFQLMTLLELLIPPLSWIWLRAALRQTDRS